MRRHHATMLAALALLVVAGSAGCRGPAPSSPPLLQAPPVPPSVHLLLRVGERRLYLIDDDPGTPIESFPVAVGRAGRETPIGKFTVEEMVEHPHFDVVDPNDRARLIRRIPPGPENPLGERWIGFLRDDGGSTGIHGTPHPELLGKAVSGGCVRMRNADIVRIYDRIRLGTPVVIEP